MKKRFVNMDSTFQDLEKKDASGNSTKSSAEFNFISYDADNYEITDASNSINKQHLADDKAEVPESEFLKSHSDENTEQSFVEPASYNAGFPEDFSSSKEESRQDILPEQESDSQNSAHFDKFAVLDDEKSSSKKKVRTHSKKIQNEGKSQNVSRPLKKEARRPHRDHYYDDVKPLDYGKPRPRIFDYKKLIRIGLILAGIIVGVIVITIVASTQSETLVNEFGV